jgi:hypothetical protein
MKIKFLLILIIFWAAEASASKKYLICSGSYSMTVEDVENKTGKRLRYQDPEPDQKFATYILENSKLYDENLREISNCKVSQTMITCESPWESNSWDPEEKHREKLQINRVNGRIETESISHRPTLYEKVINATQIVRFVMKGFCDLKNDTKF